MGGLRLTVEAQILSCRWFHSLFGFFFLFWLLYPVVQRTTKWIQDFHFIKICLLTHTKLPCMHCMWLCPRSFTNPPLGTPTRERESECSVDTYFLWTLSANLLLYVETTTCGRFSKKNVWLCTIFDENWFWCSLRQRIDPLWGFISVWHGFVVLYSRLSSQKPKPALHENGSDMSHR